jgi:pyruvate/2-oxoglutarate dehydrogenase complex dihydrolipoamide dehydrogenase (E3) component
MSPEHVEFLILGSGQGGKLLAWHMAQSGRRTAVVERRWVDGSCPNVACLPSKNEIWGKRYARRWISTAKSAPQATPTNWRSRSNQRQARESVHDLRNPKLSFSGATS